MTASPGIQMMQPVEERNHMLGTLLPAFLLLLSFFSALYCVFHMSELPAVYKDLWILPAAHLELLFLFYFGLYHRVLAADVPALLITLVYTIRNGLTPAIMISNGVYSSKMGMATNEVIANTGIAVFVWETFLVFAAVAYFSRHKVHTWKSRIAFRNNTLFKSLLLAGLAVSALCFLILPELRSEYYTIFNRDITNIVSEEASYSGGIKRALSTAGNSIIEGVRFVGCSWVILTLKKKWGNMLSYLTSFMLVGLQFLLMNDSNAYIIMLALALCVLILRLYPEKRRKTLLLMGSIGFAFAVLIAVNRFLKSSWAQSLSLFLQGYFPGLSNFSSVESITDSDFLTRIRQILYDLYSCVPFRSSLFGYNGGMDNTRTLWVAATGKRNQILPNMALGYYYFGVVLAPLLSLLMIRAAYGFFDKLNRERNPIRYALYVYLVMYTCITPVMYSDLIFLKMFLNRYLFMWIFACLSNYSFEECQTGPPVFLLRNPTENLKE